MGVVDDELKLHGIDGLRVLNAGSYLDQHQRADDDDRREECGDHQGGRGKGWRRSEVRGRFAFSACASSNWLGSQLGLARFMPSRLP